MKDARQGDDRGQVSVGAVWVKWSGVEESLKSSERGQVGREIAAICVADPSQLFLRASGWSWLCR